VRLKGMKIMEGFNWRCLLNVVWKVVSVFFVLLGFLVATNWNNFKLYVKFYGQFSELEQVYESGIAELSSVTTLDQMRVIENSVHRQEKALGTRIALTTAEAKKQNDNVYTDFFIDVMRFFVDIQEYGQEVGNTRNWYHKVLASKKREFQTVSTNENTEAEVTIRSSSPVLDDAVISGRSFSFNAENLVDGSLATSWQPKTAINGFFVIGMKEPARYEVSIINGFADTSDQLGDLYTKNNRVKTLKIEYGENFSKSAHVACADNIRAFQKLGVFETKEIRVTVLEVYPGEAWHDTAISEIRVRRVNEQ